jgi:hypothetical protein
MGEVQKHNSHCLIKKESLLSSNHQPVAAKHGVRSRTNNPFILLLLSLIFLLPTLNAQIKIEERVEIEAQTYQLNSPTNPTEPTFTYILSWPTSQYWRGTIKIVSCYGDTTTTGWTSGGYATITMPGRGHHIFNMITERWYYDNQKGWGWYEDLHPEAVRKVLINNQEWNKFNLLGAMIGTIDIPLLRMNDDICDSGYVKLEIVATNWSDCEEIGWLPIDELKLRITKGTEFASFYNKRTNTNLGSQVQINPFVELENLRLFFGFEWEEDGFDEVVIKFNENVPADSIPVNIEVEAEINGVVFSGENIFFHTDRPLIKAEINPNKITGGEETSINIELLNRCAVDPFTTLNIEIIEGQEFGNLINPYTNEKTKIITNLFQRWGYAWAPYLADNAPIDEIKEVTIRVSTSDPSFPPRDIKLYILPSPIYAYTVPEVLGADEEADVIIMKRNPDGTLEDFPAEQTFELAVLDGCVNGNFMVNGVIDVYFAAAQQPIKFVTADSIDTEFDKVLMRIGTDLSGSYRPIGGANGEEEKKRAEYESRKIGANGKTIKELRESFEKMIAERKVEAEVKSKAEAEAVTKEGGEPMFSVVNECALDNPTYQFNTYTNVALQGGCDNMAIEQHAITYNLLEQPEYFKVPHSDEEELKLVELILVCNDDSYARQYGGSAPVDYKRYRYDYNSNSFNNSWILEPYKGSDDRVHYNFINPETNEPTTLIFDFVTGVCYLKINGSNPPKTLIESLNDVDNYSKIPSDDYEQAFTDFCGHLCYKLETATYVLIEIIQIHEREHMNDFAEELENNFPALVESIKEVSDLCDSYSETVRKNAEKVIYKKISDFIKDVTKIYLEKSGAPGSAEERDHEREIQKRPSITNRIEEYKDALKMRFHQLVGRDCQKCSYEGEENEED